MKFLLAALAPLASLAAPDSDVVSTLPGYGPVDGLYSGYLNYQLDGRDVSTHYLFTKQAKDSPPSDKLIFWSNGGPGASSFFGFMTEVGPFTVNDDSLNTDDYDRTGVPTVFDNSNSWSNLGDLLIFEAPAPVGFSYCGDDPKVRFRSSQRTTLT